MNTGLKISALFVMLVAALMGVTALVPPIAPKTTVVDLQPAWVYFVSACDKPAGIFIHAEPPIWLPAEIIPSLSSVTIEMIDEAFAAGRYTALSVNEFCPAEKSRV